MPHSWKTLIRCCIALGCGQAIAAAPAVWSGLGVTFSKAAGADPSLQPNQDQITSHVAITRGDMAGLYNAVLESSYDRIAHTAPADTEWATSINNPGQTIAASNWANLSFIAWADAYGGHVGLTIVNLDAVAHLITDNVYLDLRVTDWGGGETGGEFTYQRAAAPAASGDYDHDGIVDAADYTLWRSSLGQTVPLGTAADGNLNGTIDAGDYEVWKGHFGQSAASAASAAAVPEPTGALLALLAFSSGLMFALSIR
jgi:hypothetical protein